MGPRKIDDKDVEILDLDEDIDEADIEVFNQDLQKLEKLAALMDTRFKIPFTNIRFGLDPLIGLFPFLGDIISIGVASYIASHADHYEMPPEVRAKIWRNVVIDFAAGSIPFAGDILDIGLKANAKNVALLKKHARPKKRKRKPNATK